MAVSVYSDKVSFNGFTNFNILSKTSFQTTTTIATATLTDTDTSTTDICTTIANRQQLFFFFIFFGPLTQF